MWQIPYLTPFALRKVKVTAHLSRQSNTYRESISPTNRYWQPLLRRAFAFILITLATATVVFGRVVLADRTEIQALIEGWPFWAGALITVLIAAYLLVLGDE